MAGFELNASGYLVLLRSNGAHFAHLYIVHHGPLTQAYVIILCYCRIQQQAARAIDDPRRATSSVLHG